MTPHEALRQRLLASVPPAEAAGVRALRGRLWRECLVGWSGAQPRRAHAALREVRDTDLLRAAQEGDALAMDELLGRHLPKLYGYALRSVRSVSAAEDVVQNALVTLLQRLPGLELGRDEVLPLLFTFVHHRAVDWIRVEVRTRASDIEELREAELALNSLDKLLVKLDTQRLLDALVACCDLLEQEVVLLVLDDKSHDEIAECLDLTVVHVRVLKHRALVKLRKELGGDP